MRQEVLKCLTGEGDSIKQKPFAKTSLEKSKLEEIFQVCAITSSTRKNWLEKSVVPLDALIEFNDSSEEFISEIEYITDYKDSARFQLPEKPISSNLAYIVGLAAGDGGFSNDNLWTLVDGGKDHQLQQSKEFLEDISNKIEEVFGVNTGFRKRGNRFEIYISNKWFCRFLRNFYGLPRSYKKGKLSKPQVFEGRECSRHFWGGVFDADGSVADKSNRISLSSATRSFLEECRSDLNDLGIDVHEIRKPAAYLLRLKPEQLPLFAREIGFSHPRKRELLLEKLEKGSRSYTFGGRTDKFIGEYYDLSEVDRLRVFDAGDKIKEYRNEKDLYQKELASELGVSKNQIYYWENGEYATPISVLDKIFESKEDLLDYLIENENKFKYGRRGNEKSAVVLPKKEDEEVIEIAEKCIATSNKLRIRSKNYSIAEKIEKRFDTKIREKNKLMVDSLTVYNFFSTFYNYQRKFEPWDKNEIKELQAKLEI